MNAKLGDSPKSAGANGFTAVKAYKMAIPRAPTMTVAPANAIKLPDLRADVNPKTKAKGGSKLRQASCSFISCSNEHISTCSCCCHLKTTLHDLLNEDHYRSRQDQYREDRYREVDAVSGKT
jgi:hypothetical protein